MKSNMKRNLVEISKGIVSEEPIKIKEKTKSIDILLKSYPKIFLFLKNFNFMLKRTAKVKGTRRISMFISLYVSKSNSLHHQKAKTIIQSVTHFKT